jgi:hypothetical protein
MITRVTIHVHLMQNITGYPKKLPSTFVLFVEIKMEFIFFVKM